MDEILGIFAVVTYQVAQLYVVECREPLWRLQSGKHALGGKASRWLRRNPLRPVHWRAQTPHTSVNDQLKQIGQQSTDTERAPAAVNDVPMGPGDTG